MHSLDGVRGVANCGCVVVMPLPCVVALMAQTNDTVLRGPHYRLSRWLLLSWPSLVVATATGNHFTGSRSSMTEPSVDCMVAVVCEAPHWLLIATRLRCVRASLLRSSATVLWSRAVASGSMVFEVECSSSPSPPRCSSRAGRHRSGVCVRAIGLHGPWPAHGARLYDRAGQ